MKPSLAKTMQVIRSCKTHDQMFVAWRYMMFFNELTDFDHDMALTAFWNEHFDTIKRGIVR